MKSFYQVDLSEVDGVATIFAQASKAFALLLNERLTGSLLDRLTHHVNILEMNGECYRLNQSRARLATAGN